MLPSGPFPGKWTFFGFYLVSVIIVLLKLRCFGVIGSVYMHACTQACEKNRRRVRDGELHGFVGGGSLPSFNDAEARRESVLTSAAIYGRAGIPPMPGGIPSACSSRPHSQSVGDAKGDGREKKRRLLHQQRHHLPCIIIIILILTTE